MNIVTLGGLTAGIGILLLTGMRWWFREGHKGAALVPFFLAFAYGMLAIISTGGLVSGIAGATLWGANGLGDLALVYGVGGHSANVTRGAQTALSDGGYVVVLLLTLVIIGLAKWAKKIPISKLVFGALAGICLGLSGTVAGVAAVPLASAANGVGLIFTAML
jgi:hypothetical protein